MRVPFVLRFAALFALLLALTISTTSAAGKKTGPKTPPKQTTSKSRPGQRRQQPKAPILPLGWPKTLIIHKLNIRAPVEDISLSRPGDGDAPFRWGDVAWYDRGPKPGQVGRATIFGHLDSYCCPAVFYLLRNLSKGDTFQVQYKRGAPLAFRVTWANSFLNTQLPMKYLYGRTRERGVALITCAGIFHRDGTGYDHKLIVYGTLVR